MGGIVAGLFTPTEAAAVAVVYALVVPPLFYKELACATCRGSSRTRRGSAGVIGLIIGLVGAFGWVLTYSKFPFQVAAAIQSVAPSWWLFMTLVIVLYLFLGTFLTPSEIILVTVPVLLPGAQALGIHPIHFGMVCVIASAVGHVTPPVGLCLFLGMAISGLPMEKLIKPLVPFLIAIVTVLLIVAFVPETVLLVPPATGLREVTFYLVRHGAAASGPDDRVRPLTREGRAEIETTARALAARGVDVAEIRHSGSPVRARARRSWARRSRRLTASTRRRVFSQRTIPPLRRRARASRGPPHAGGASSAPRAAERGARRVAALERIHFAPARRWGSGAARTAGGGVGCPGGGRAAPASAAPRLRPVRRRGAPRPAFEGCRACAADPRGGARGGLRLRRACGRRDPQGLGLAGRRAPGASGSSCRHPRTRPS